jgi:SAM-dependent methyltransferase
MNDLQSLANALSNHQVQVAQQLYQLLSNHSTNLGYHLNHNTEDTKALLVRLNGLDTHRFELQTEHPVAFESNDHLYPRGTKNDSTRSPRFVGACESKFPGRAITHLDLGCAGGGLVFDFIKRGHASFGLEGSDYSFKWKRAEWGCIPNSLRTCDITKPFEVIVSNNKSRAQFDIVTMWEVFEHIPADLIPGLLYNVKKHMHAGSFFVGSIALFDDIENGVSFHPTIKPKEWWSELFENNGFKMYSYEYFEFADHCRGVGNGPGDNNFHSNPELGFHFTACLI